MTQEATHSEDGIGVAGSVRSGATVPPAESITAYSHANPIVSRLVRFADAAAFVLVTCLAVFLISQATERLRSESLEVAGAVGVLIFLLFPKNQALLSYPGVTLPGRQMRYLAPPLAMALGVEFLILWGLGWRSEPAIAAGLPIGAGPVVAISTIRALGMAILARPAIQGRLARRIAIVGYGTEASRIAALFRRQGSNSFNLVGVFDDGARKPNEPPVDGSMTDLVALSREHRLHSVIIVLPASEGHERQVSRLAWRMRSILADVYIMPYLVHGPDMMLPAETLGPLTLMVLQRRPLTEWQLFAKSTLDLVAATLAVLFLLPLLLFVAAAIRLDSPGPVLFRQPRQGFNNRPFTVFKFRSMYIDQTDLEAARQTSRGDPRVTRVGKWLRRLSIDELPQLLNVLRGDMSLVGPRPHAPHTRAGGKLLDDALAEYVIRHQVKPGITVWAQVNGARGELVTTDDLQRRVRYDLDYIRRWSMWFDVKIIWLTIIREIVSPHAF